MKIFLLLSIIIFAIFFIAKNFFYSARRDLFKDHAAWSGKDIKIKYSITKEFLKSESNENYLKIIADESKVYLEDECGKQAE